MNKNKFFHYLLLVFSGIFLSLSLYADDSMNNSKESLCPVSHKATLRAQVENYIGFMNKTLEEAYQKGNPSYIRDIETIYDACANEIAIYFQKTYFEPAYNNQGFDEIKYEKSLKQLQSFAKEIPANLTKLATKLQTKWENVFLSSYIFELRKTMRERNDKTMGALNIATLLIPAGTKFSKLYLRLFKKLPILGSLTAASTGQATTIGISYVANELLRINADMHISGEGYNSQLPPDNNNRKFKIKQIQKLPASPAHKLNLAVEAGDIIKVDLENVEFWKKLSQDVTQFFGNWAAFYVVRAVFTAAKLASMPCLPALVISAAVGFVVEEVTQKIEDAIHLESLQNDFKIAVQEFKEKAKKDKLFDATLATTALINKAYKLELYYRMKSEMNGLGIVPETTSSLTYETLKFFQKLTLSEDNDIDTKLSYQLLRKFQQAAVHAYSESLFRDETYQKSLERMTGKSTKEDIQTIKKELTTALETLNEHLTLQTEGRKRKVDEKSEDSTLENQSHSLTYSKDPKQRLLNAYKTTRNSLPFAEMSEEKIREVLETYSLVENLLKEYKFYLYDRGIRFDLNKEMQIQSDLGTPITFVPGEAPSPLLNSESKYVLGIRNFSSREGYTYTTYPNRSLLTIDLPTFQKGLFQTFLTEEWNKLKTSMAEKALEDEVTLNPKQLLLETAFLIEQTAKDQELYALNYFSEEILVNLNRNFFDGLFGPGGSK